MSVNRLNFGDLAPAPSASMTRTTHSKKPHVHRCVSGCVNNFGDRTGNQRAVILRCGVYRQLCTSLQPPVPPRITHPIAISIYYTSILVPAPSLHLLALHYDKPEGIRTNSTRICINPCTTHVPRTTTHGTGGTPGRKCV